MIKMRSSMLPTGEKCERMFGFNWLVSTGLAADYGFTVRPRKNHVGTVVGSAAHDGVAFLLKQFHAKGNWGDKTTAKHAASYAGEYVARESRESGMIFDNTSKSAQFAVAAATNIVNEYHTKITPKGQTEIIEKNLGCIFQDPISGTEYEVTGTVDRFIILDGVLRDLKTSPKLKSHHAQIGAYIDILETHGYEVRSALIDHIPRTRPGRMQDPLKVVKVGKAMARGHSRSVHAKMHNNVERFIDCGNPSVFVANPSCDLCNPKFCQAYGTEFCPIGISVNG